MKSHRQELKRQVMGREVVVAITDGKLDLGPWEQIFFCIPKPQIFTTVVVFFAHLRL